MKIDTSDLWVVYDSDACSYVQEVYTDKAEAQAACDQANVRLAEISSQYPEAKLAPYKVPARIEFRTELPKTMVGKVLRRALKEGG